MDLMNTRIGEMLTAAATLDEVKAWEESITDDLKRKIIRDWLQEDQLFKQGVDGDGEVIGLYSRMTEIISKGRKKAGDKFTLFDTGDFYKSMEIIVLSDSFIIDAETEKMEDKRWYSEEILNLTDENFIKLSQEIKENYREYVRRRLGVDLRNAFI
jgi:hypothetical protein